MNQPQPKRMLEVEGMPIRVYDGLISDEHVGMILDALNQSPFARTESARPETQDTKHWVRNLPLDASSKLPLFQPTLAAAAGFCAPGEQLRAYRTYCNYASYGDMLYTHTDCLPGAGEVTALWFIVPQWDPEWGGETVFFDSSMDAVGIVSPRPGRLVLFDGSITHAGRPPNRNCYAPRYTFALKLEKVARS